MAKLTVTYDYRLNQDHEDEVRVKDDYALHLVVMAECICCQNNWNDPEGHKHTEHCYA